MGRSRAAAGDWRSCRITSCFAALRSSVSAARPIETFLDLSDGDYVVHVVHGIGRFIGMKTLRRGDSRQSEEFLTLRFADDAVLHVPASQIDLVQKYVGPRAG